MLLTVMASGSVSSQVLLILEVVVVVAVARFGYILRTADRRHISDDRLKRIRVCPAPRIPVHLECGSIDSQSECEVTIGTPWVDSTVFAALSRPAAT